MKTRFSTYDIMCMVTELQRLIGMRVNQVYDIDSRTYVIRLQQSEEKAMLLLESGNRFHTTLFEWPKNVAPSGFTMKLRKHLKNKRLEKLSQIGIDRVVDLQFGSGEAAYHIILELYDRGNIMLTDCEWTILNVLRPHVEGDKVRFAVKEKYPLDRAKTSYEAPNGDILKDILAKSKPGDNLKKILNPNLEYGSSIIDHVLQEAGLAGTMKVAKEPGKPGFHVEQDLEKLVTALKQAEKLLDDAKTQVSKGYITQKKEERANPDDGEPSYLLTNVEFHPMLYHQMRSQPHEEHETFDRAVDEFFSTVEGQKIDLKTVQIEREAMKKLQNVRQDHQKRVSSLKNVQVRDKHAAELIARNEPLVEQCRMAIQTAIANQMSWDDIKLLVKTAQENNDPIACCIQNLKLSSNHIALNLTDPYPTEEPLQAMTVDIDLSLTAFANARRYYDQKRGAAKKQQKTLESADKALKSAERKTKQTLKEANTVSNIIKARRTYWFEKFYWFISSDNYLVIGGRDQQQNELLVKRYMRSTDIYVHADVTGAASIIVKNPTGAPVPPRTLNEAGQAAVAYSVAWEAKVVTRAWWVSASQVSKSAPTGEYLGTGSFMIRGKKSFLLTDQLSFGFSFMFRLEDSCIERHRDERKPATVDDTASHVTSVQDQELEEIHVSDGDDDESERDEPSTKLDTITEESPKHTPKKNVVQKTETHVEKTEGLKETNSQSETKTDTECEKETREDQKKERNDCIEEKETDDADLEERSEMQDSDDDEYPDTHIKVDHGTGEVILKSKVRTMSEASDRSDDRPLSFPSLPKKGGKKPQKTPEVKQEVKKESSKRGHKGKLKKMKEKYKDQDDEDRRIAMEILQSAKDEKETKKFLKKVAAKGGKSKQKQGPKIPQPAPLILEDSEPEDVEDNPEPETETQATETSADMELLCQLTGAPTAEDELLFAVPVVGPYSALLNYKYKVKLTPGTSKRGKAAKTAVQVFLRDKAASNREKDLLKAVKEENVARNFPGKVKLSAPQLHKHKK